MTLSDLIANTRCLLIDFDGPICSVFAGYPAAAVADELRTAIRRQRGELPRAVADLSPDPLQILVEVAALGDDSLTCEIGDVLRDAENTAVAVATPTPGANDLLRAAHETGRRVAIVSNNASAAIEAYLRDHDLIRYVDGLAARFDGMDPHLLKPHPFLLECGLTAVGLDRDDAVFIGDSVSDIEAGRAAQIPTIGYANKSGKHQRLTDAGADLVIESMNSLVDALHQDAARSPR
ncbi:hydrolase [Actinoplanes italicus]|uniref:HAD superfamily hydrolase (TIGR01509 family) n=1 Tax=Actinoplanes italicus TaxID=113567 RepID=A0A2T0JZM7_9ACTN|nr:HAD family hydrolase [Actinoplanes italicus]PRX15972.1 HAD superfamily hydrolase (TIGR01509 family) [Actinoplanes italicus]GIE32269.1 hydrolase [Actinoplanes italicus]